MKTSIRLPILMVIAAFGLAPAAIAQNSGSVDVTAVAAPPASSADLPAGGGYPPKPDGVPTDLHRQVVKLYQRLHAAHPDASRQRIFSKIGEELGIAPERLWNAYHDQGGGRTPPLTAPPLTKAETLDRSDKLTVRRADRPVADAVRGSVRSAVPEGGMRVERVARAERPQRLERVRPAERPQRGR